jgi:hypothetical protein
MSGIPWNRCCIVYLIVRLYELEWVKKTATLVTLVASCIVILALRTCSFDETVCKEGIMALAIRLGSRSFFQITVLMKFQEGILCDDSLLLCGCSTEVIETNLEPMVDILVLLVEFVVKFFWCLFCL